MTVVSPRQKPMCSWKMISRTARNNFWIRFLRYTILLDEVRKSVLLNMCISIPQSRFAPLREPCYLGIGGLLGFNNTLAFIAAGDWELAANGMLASKWAKQVGMRAIELSEMMRKGQ